MELQLVSEKREQVFSEVESYLQANHFQVVSKDFDRLIFEVIVFLR